MRRTKCPAVLPEDRSVACEWPWPPCASKLLLTLLFLKILLALCRHVLPQPTNSAGSNLFGQQQNTTPGQVHVHARVLFETPKSSTF